MSLDIKRTPPQNIDAERAVLGAMLLPDENKLTISKVLKIIPTSDMFYKEAHSKIFDTMRNMYISDISIDLVTLTRELDKKGELEKVGDVSYLDEMMDSVPTSANVEYYANFVVEDYLRRKIVIMSAKINSCIYDSDFSFENVSLLLEETQKLVGPKEIQVTKIKDLISGFFKEIVNIKENGFTKGIMTGLSEYDKLVLGYLNGTYNTIAARPGNCKSMLLVNIALNMAINGYNIGIYSLEMNRNEILLRMFSNISKIPLYKLRTGSFSDTDFPKIVESSNVLYNLRININDNSYKLIDIINDISNKSNEDKYDIIFIDYIQLMQASFSGSNRNAELTEISNGIKRMARRFNIPVVVLSQLSREIEKRPNHKPQLSDLRDSGCLKGNTQILCHNHSYLQEIKSLNNDKDSVIIYTYSTNKGELIMTDKSKCFNTGLKQFYHIELITGHQIEATETHKFLCPNTTWIKLRDLKQETMIGLPLKFIEQNNNLISQDELKMLALFLGNGCSLPKHSLQYTSHIEDIDICEEIMQIANNITNNELHPFMKTQSYKPNTTKSSRTINVFFPAKKQVSRKYRNPLVLFFEKYGLYGQRHKNAEIPSIIFSQNNANKQLFLKYLWSTDGCICISNGKKVILTISYSSKSELLIKQLQLLLQSLGILSHIKQVKQKQFIWYSLNIYSRYFQNKFLIEIGIAGKRNELELQKALSKIAITSSDWTKYELSADHSVIYVPIKSISKTDIDIAYDIEVKETHNFIANGIIVHNSIEQDSDTITFISHPHEYDKTEPEYKVELIVGKQRQGPTGVVLVTCNKSIMLFSDWK